MIKNHLLVTSGISPFSPTIPDFDSDGDGYFICGAQYGTGYGGASGNGYGDGDGTDFGAGYGAGNGISEELAPD